jgi:hypothetical protein
MRKIFFLLLLAASLNSFSQGKTIYSVSYVKPKIGMTSAFETAWKAHVAKFHNGDDKRFVFEVLSGDMAGYYAFVEGPMSFSDMDVEKTGQAGHDMDYEKTVAPTLAEETGIDYYQYIDSLSINATVTADKSIVTFTHIKNGRMGDYRNELARAKAVVSKLNWPQNNYRYQKMNAGTNPVMVSVYNLKDGFKQLEADYFKNVPNVRDAYIAMYGWDSWQKRLDLLADITVKTEVYMRKRRADLSSK